MAEEKGEQQITNPNYKGKAENFKKNFRKSTAEKPKQQPKVPAGPKSATLPPPSNTKGMENPTKQREEPIYKESIFAAEVHVRENNSRKQFAPNLVGYMPIVNEMWTQMRVDEKQIDKQMFIEAIRYYATALLWARIIQLKISYGSQLTHEEQDMANIIDMATFNIPEPIFLYLKALGEIQVSTTGQKLYPRFPALPTETDPNDIHGGYYGRIDVHNHNLYEEIPCLGVMAEAIRNAMNLANNGWYESSLDEGDVAVNENLLGYAQLSHRLQQGLNVVANYNIDENVFPETIPSSGFNLDIVYAISLWFSKTETFKIQNVSFKTLGFEGSQAQVLVQRPVAYRNVILNVNSELRQTSLAKVSDTSFGIGYYGLFQMMKLSREFDPNENESIASQVWCCQTYDGALANTTIPPEYLANMNVRRDLPIEYNSERFEAVPLFISQARKRTINLMVVSHRTK